MYLYIHSIYQQWIQGDYNRSGEDFIMFVHNYCGYDEDILREFLLKQKWFELKLERGQDGNAED